VEDLVADLKAAKPRADAVATGRLEERLRVMAYCRKAGLNTVIPLLGEGTQPGLGSATSLVLALPLTLSQPDPL
jgi:hypothetical protein